jgi:hypothetical protein
MPVPHAHSAFGGLEPVDEVDSSEAAPVVNIEDERDEAIPLMPSRAKPPSLRPEESFADIDAELASDRAPAAPVTPWRSVPALGSSDASEKTPPRASLLSVDMTRDEEPEPTMVGKVPENLLELSSGGGGDENTRAFTAPRELIELAKRKREERFESKAPAEAHVRDTQRPPAAPARAEAEVEAEETFDDDADMAAPAVRAESAPPSAPPPQQRDADAAPPVARTYSGEMEAVSMPRRQRESDPPAGSGPLIEVEPASDVSLPRSRDEIPIPSSAVASSGGPKSMSLQRIMIVVALCVIVGVVLARWRELMLLLHR